MSCVVSAFTEIPDMIVYVYTVQCTPLKRTLIEQHTKFIQV